MLKNYSKVALRSIRRHKGYSLINITGLAIGMACCVLILLWVQDELSYDKFHKNVGNLYRIARETESGGRTFYQATVPPLLASALKNEIPEVMRSTRFDYGGKKLITYGDKSFQNDIVGMADPDFFEMFSFPFLKGNSNTAFIDTFSVVITEEMGRKYFDDEDPLGKVISIDRDSFKITGVLKNIPHNSHLWFDCLVPFSSRSERLKKIVDNWRVHVYYTYVQLHEGSRIAEVNQKMSSLMTREVSSSTDKQFNLSLQPLIRIHLYHDVKDFLKGHGNIKYVYLFSALALLILLVACVNFINLTTARSGERAREVGMRKVVGANKVSLIYQFLCESLVLALIALSFALVLVELSLPSFNAWSKKQLSLGFSINTQIILGLLGVLLVSGIVAGGYPALVLSSFRPAKVLKGHLKSGGTGSAFRKILVIVQFSLSICLIIGASIIHNQLRYVRKTDLGFDKEQLLYIYMEGDLKNNYEVIKNELIQAPAILGVTAGSPPTVDFDGVTSVNWEGKESDEKLEFSGLAVDYDYIDVLGMEIMQGRNFSKEFFSDKAGSFIINETAARLVGKESPVGKEFSFSSFGNQLEAIERQGKIIGVVKDFHSASLHNKIEPLVMYLDQMKLNAMCIRVSTNDIEGAVGLLKGIWNRYVPERPFVYQFVDEILDRYYRAEQRLSTIFNFFTMLAVFVSCLGLFSLASFMAERRTKEIGIRKVLGATASNIIFLLSTEFSKWVLVSNIIAWPIAYYAMNRWLQGFAYRTNIGLWTFFLAALVAFMIALFTVSYQAIKAAVTNPVDALRYE